MNTEGATALAKVEPTTVEKYTGLEMAISPREARRRLQELRAFVKSVMVRGEDYGRIPGTNKDVLYKPGAEKLTEIYGIGWKYEDVEIVQDWDKGLFFYRKKCILFARRDGTVLCEGVGSCNSREDKYAWRWLFESELPDGIDKKTLVSKKRTSKNGKPYTVYRVANEDPYTLVNTVEKMAAKRAMVDAVKGATRSSDLFTQDLEDLPEDVFGHEDPSRSWEKGSDATIEYADPKPVLAAVKKAANVQALNKIAKENRDKNWTEEDRDAIKQAIDARKASLRKENERQSPSDAPPGREPGDDSDEEYGED